MRKKRFLFINQFLLTSAFTVRELTANPKRNKKHIDTKI